MKYHGTDNYSVDITNVSVRKGNAMRLGYKAIIRDTTTDKPVLEMYSLVYSHITRLSFMCCKELDALMEQNDNRQDEAAQLLLL